MDEPAMTLEELVHHVAGWLDGSGDHAALVLSSRIRLARNLADFPFTHQAKPAQLREIVRGVLRASREVRTFKEATYFATSRLSEMDRQVLVERHLISPALARERAFRGILVTDGEQCSVMINEEDHLRVQVMQSGLQLREGWEQADRLDDELSCALRYAYSDRYGYLTACPTNAGTGLRASVLIHLPGLVLVQEMDQVIRGLSEVGLAVRGFYGEGTDAAGNLFQISNQVTMGYPEEETIRTLTDMVHQVLKMEIDTRELLIRDARSQIEDKIWRASGILYNARLLTAQEFMSLSSAVRLGYSMGVLSGPGPEVMNELMVSTQPSHLQRWTGTPLDPAERDVLRASVVRKRLREG